MPQEAMESREVLVFAGQGSETHFSAYDTVERLLENLQSDQSRFTSFLTRCRNGFHEIFNNLHTDERSIFYDDTLANFSTPNDFLLPRPPFHSHPVFESTTLYVHQILELMLYQRINHGTRIVVEASGICTGVLPAILTASFSSYLSDDFINAAVNGFKVAVLIGLRASLWCRTIAGEHWNSQPWVVTVFGVSSSVVGELLRRHSKSDSHAKCGMQISAILDDKTVSVTGPGDSLDFLQSAVRTSTSGSSCRWAHVHGYYHGGEDLRSIVSQVLADARRFDIQFPEQTALHVPLRSAATGQLLQSSNSDRPSLLEIALTSIFIEPVNWENTFQSLITTYSQRLEHDALASYRIVGLGPSANSLFVGRKDAVSNQRLRIVMRLSDEPSRVKAEDIAIIGVSANFPSGKGLQEFWSLIYEGRSTATEIPSSRFQILDYYNENNSQTPEPRKMATKHGNFLDSPFQFDAQYFSISPREAKSIDPQQRLLLHAAVEALDDAGYSPNSTPNFNKDSFGVYVGVATGDYIDNLRDSIDVYYSPGNLRAFLSGRISYAFGFKGPSMVIDTACSSSLVSIYHACRALQNGDCTAAIAGAANTISSPDMYLGLSRAHFLSPTGQCKPFDASADGYCRSEGCGVVVLKKLSDAILENDHIRGVIRGVEINQCGDAKSITHPDHETQAALFSQVLKSSGVSPDSIEVVEAHGTGTQAGDFAEISSLSAVFGARENLCHLGSVKGNIGHAEAASGVAGLIKLILMMKNDTIPPQASFKTLNPRLTSMTYNNMAVPTSAQHWKGTPSRPRRALLNNFGAAGSNAALVLEEPPRIIRAMMPSRPRSQHIFNLSARSVAALERLKSAYIQFVKSNPGVSIEDLCYSVNVRRQHHKRYRWSATCIDQDELLKKLQVNQNPLEPTISKSNTKTMFIFSGQGGAHQGMGAELLRTAPEFETAVDTCDSILASHGFPTIRSFLNPVSGDNTLSRSDRDQIIIEQCACFVVEYSLAQLWISFEIAPDIVLGHSIGEYAALVTAGVLTISDALLFIARRADLMFTHCERKGSSMLACRMAPEDVLAMLEEQLPEGSGDISIACFNSPFDSVLAGPTALMNQFANVLKIQGFWNKLLPVSYGFHSSAMDSILPDLEALSPSMLVRRSTLELGSSALGKLIADDEILPSNFFATQTRQPVRFMHLLQDIENKNTETYFHIVEIGPSPSTKSMVRSAFKRINYMFLPSLQPTVESWVSITTSLQSLYLSGSAIKWAEVYKGTALRFLPNLPYYPIAGEDFVVPFREYRGEAQPATKEAVPGRSEVGYEFIKSPSTALTHDWSRSLQVEVHRLSDFINAHVVGGVPLCPASVYLELVLEAISSNNRTSRQPNPFSMHHVSFDCPLVYSESRHDSLSIEVLPEEQAQSTKFTVATAGSENLHCSGLVSTITQKAATDLFTIKGAYFRRQRELSLCPASNSTLETLKSRTIYEGIFPRVVAYSEPFLTLEQLTISSSGLEGYGTFKLAKDVIGRRFVCSPAFVDTIFHTAGFIANKKVDALTACICVSFDRIVFPHDLAIRPDVDMAIYCSLVDTGHSIVADAYVLNMAEEIIACAESICYKKVRLEALRTILSRAAEPTEQATAGLRSRKHRNAVQTALPAVTENIQQHFQTTVTSVTAQIREILGAVCGISGDISTRQTLAGLGIDSLLFIELMHKITAEFPQISTYKHEIESSQIVGDLIDTITKASSLLSVPTKPGISADGSSYTPSQSYPLTPLEDLPHISAADTPSQAELILSNLCGRRITEMDKNVHLADLGLDSLLSIELVQMLRYQFGVNIELDPTEMPDITVKDIEAFCAGVAATAKESLMPLLNINSDRTNLESRQNDNTILEQLIPANFPDILQHQTDGSSQLSLYIFHDGSGLSTMYSRIKDLGRDVYGIFSLDILRLNPEIQTLEDLAELYITQAGLMNVITPILCGWSFGGVLAFEVSRQLKRRGKAPKGLILMDSPVPDNHQPLPEAVIAHVAGMSYTNPGQSESKALRQARCSIQDQFMRHASFLQKYKPRPQVEAVPSVLITCNKTMDTERLCGVAYPWLSDHNAREASFKIWERFLGRPTARLEVDCNHFEIFDFAMINEVSMKLHEACRVLQN